MILSKQITSLIGLFFVGFYTYAQQPSQATMLSYIKSKTMILYMPDMNRPDVIHEIKPGSIESASNNVIFGKTNNNQMDVSAIFLRDLLTSKNGDAQFQQSVYDLLQKSQFPIVLFFMNDVAVSADIGLLRQYGIDHYEVGDRTYLWPVSRRGPELIPEIGKRWAFVYGEYFNKDIMLMKEGFIDLFNRTNQSGITSASNSIFHSRDAVENIVKSDKDIPKISSAQLALWNRADTKQLGIIGNDWDGDDEIGTAPFERKMDLGIAHPQFLNFWYPNIRTQDNNRAWKRTMIGHMKEEAEHYENDFVFPDHDIDFYVIPDKDYEYLIKENPAPNASFYVKVDAYRHLERPSCPSVHDHVEAEIDLKDENEKQFVNFFNDQMKTIKSAGFYGTWMYDRGHCDHPEIHPAEQIWWSMRTDNVSTYRCNLICDYSDRYNTTDQMDDEGGKYTIKNAWAAPPIKGVFAISFSLNPGKDKIVYRIFQHDSYNLNANKTVAFDNNKVHHFILNGKAVITVVEPEKECLKVSFEQIAYDNAGNLTGFVVLTSAVGEASKYPEPGHLFFEVKKSVVKGASNPPGKFKVSLESIECTGAEDANLPENIFGSIFCKAIATKDTVSYRPLILAVKANTAGNLCNSKLETLFCASCSNLISLKKNQKNTFSTSFTYDFPSDGYIEVTGDLDKADNKNCNPPNYLGQEQKTYVLTNEIGSSPYRFTQFFASGKTVIKANYSIQKVQ